MRTPTTCAQHNRVSLRYQTCSSDGEGAVIGLLLPPPTGTGRP
jgi:hypothetical protein